MRVPSLGALVVCALVATPVPARADSFLTPFVGSLFGADAPESSFAWGGSLSSYGDGLFGFELDVTHAPDFFDFSLGAFDVWRASIGLALKL